MGASFAGEQAAHAEGRVRGMLLVLMGSLCFSTGGLILRGFETGDGWLILLYRSIPYCLLVLAFLAFRHGRGLGRALLGVGRYGPLLGLAIAGSSIFYIFAVQRTTVANVLFTFSCAPFLAALLGWWLLKEKVSPVTWAAMVLAGGGVALMVADGLGSGTLIGNLLALGMALSYACVVILVRHARGIDMLPATVWGAVVSAAIAAMMVPSYAIGLQDLGLATLFGTVNMGTGIMLITLGARHVPAAQAVLLGLLESVLAPLWVWLGVGETPSLLTLMGGAIVLIAVVGQTLAGMRGQPAGASPAGGAT